MAKHETGDGWFSRYARLLLVALGAIGLALIVIGHHSHWLEHHGYSDVASALGDAAFVSAITGAVIERPLKRKFAEEVAKDVFLTLFGVSAPPEYIRSLEALCRTDRLSYQVSWVIEFYWDHKPDRLKVRMQARNSLLNIGPKSWEPTDLWLMGSLPGSPGSHFEQYEAAIASPDGQTLNLPSKTAKEMLSLQSERLVDGAVSIPSASLLREHSHIKPGHRLSLSMTGVTYLSSSDMIPLVHSYPSLRTSFVFRGDALDDLAFVVTYGTVVLSPERKVEQGQYASISFNFDILTMPGSTFRVNYSPK